MATKENLKAAFAGESQANRMYLAFAKKAEDEGMKQIAKLFRATAEAETIHAHAHFRVMGGVQGTADNLKAAAKGEAYEFESMYPGFLEEAEKEGNKPAATSFRYAMDAERVHHGLYLKALESAEAGGDLEAKPVYLCPFCGNIEIGEVPESCSVCGAPREKFVEVK